MKSIALPATHYAYHWPANLQHTSAELTELGQRFARTQDENVLLDIIQSFHGYLVKYLSMILHGHIPFRNTSEMNTDTVLLLKCFVPRGMAVTRTSLSVACRSLHLAFKSMNQADVYDTLMMCMVRAIKKYDPCYHEKVKRVAALIDDDFHDKAFISINQLSDHLGHDSTRYVRMLSKHSFLVAETQSKVQGIKRTALWPPPAKFFESGPIGLSYFVTKWFRYYLVEWITARMKELESKEDIMQLDHRSNATPKPPRSGENVWDPVVPHAQGGFTLAHSGKSVAADLSMTRLPVDVGQITLEWVNNKQNGFFGSLTRKDRHLLYCIFAREMDWADVAATFEMTLREVRRWYCSLMTDLKERVAIWPAITG